MTRTLLRGGCIHTPGDQPASALCVEDGTILWIGGDDASGHFRDNADRVIDLDGRLVTPAFVDAHAHLAQTGFAATGLDLSATASLAEALEALDAFAAASPAAVILGSGWDETAWPEHRPFTRDEVDRATGGRAALLSRVDVHSAVLSSAFLDACPDVVHAEGYDVHGLVTREAHHAARTALFRLTTGSDREDAIAGALQDAARHGIALVHELGAPHICPAQDFDILDALDERSVVPETVRYWGSLDVEEALRLGCAGAAGDLCADGSLGSHTSALHAPYADAETSGHLYFEVDQVTEHVVSCTRTGIQAGFHAIGDRAVSVVVSGFQAAAALVGASAVVAGRHRLEHVEMATYEQMAVLGGLGVTASMQPMFDGYWGGADSLYAQRLGADRAQGMNAFASMSKAGVALAFGSDSPVTPFDPWAGIRAATRHHTESERITARTAFHAYTRGGWRAARRDEGGVIAPGAPASIAVWDVPGDLVMALPDLHPDHELPTCALTLVRGRTAYEQQGVWT